MENNPYTYDTSVPWIPQQQQQVSASRDGAARTHQQPPSPLQKQQPTAKGEGQKAKPPARMSKARALALTDTLKKGLVVASLASFVTFTGLIANHQVSTTTSQTSSGSSQTTSTATSTSTSQSSSGFLNQQGGNNIGSSTSSQGTNSSSSSSSQNSSSGTSSSSNGSSSSSQTPVSGTHSS